MSEKMVADEEQALPKVPRPNMAAQPNLPPSNRLLGIGMNGHDILNRNDEVFIVLSSSSESDDERKYLVDGQEVDSDSCIVLI